MTDTPNDKDDQIAAIIAAMTFNELVSMATEIADIIGLENLPGIDLAETFNDWAQEKVRYLEDVADD